MSRLANLAVAPLVIGTIWFSYAYGKTYDPLMGFIALRSIERKAPDPRLATPDADPDGWGTTARLRYEDESRPHGVDESRVAGQSNSA